MRKGPRWGSRGSLLLLAAAVMALTAAAAGEGGPARGEAQDRWAAVPPPGARDVLLLVAKLWASGFFKRNEAVEKELLNNTYAFFDEDSPRPPKGRAGLGCFAPGRAGNDRIFLRKELFARFEVRMDGVEIFGDPAGRAMPVLVHEICHDLWTNILDGAERAAFCREGTDFMEEYRRAQTPEDRRRFLERAGDDPADPATLRSYAGIDEILDTLPPRALRGHELFAWLAERLFTTKAPIPSPLGKFYTPILADGTPRARRP